MNELKKCSKCGQELPATNEYFYRNKAAKDGLQAYCKECVKANGKKKNLTCLDPAQESCENNIVTQMLAPMFEGHRVEVLKYGNKPLFNPHDCGKCLDHLA